MSDDNVNEEEEGQEGGEGERRGNNLRYSNKHFPEIFTLFASFNPLKGSMRELLLLSHITYKKTKVLLN